MLILFNNRVLLSKALSGDRLPEDIWCSQQAASAYMMSREENADINEAINSEQASLLL